MTEGRMDSTASNDSGGGWVRSILRCPVTQTELTEATGPDGTPELRNSSGDQPLAYPVRGGVPVLLADEARGL